MSRLMLSVLLSCAVPACVWAQQAAPAHGTAAASAAVSKPKSHNPFGEAIAELTRAAREQAQAARQAPAADVGSGASPPVTAPAPAPATSALTPALADSNGR